MLGNKERITHMSNGMYKNTVIYYCRVKRKRLRYEKTLDEKQEAGKELMEIDNGVTDTTSTI